MLILLYINILNILITKYNQISITNKLWFKKQIKMNMKNKLLLLLALFVINLTFLYLVVSYLSSKMTE